MRTVHTLENQSVTDIALQEYGAAEAVLLLLEDNPGVFSLADPYVPPGTALLIRERTDWQNTPGTDLRTAEAFRRAQTKPANGNPRPAGIGHVKIGTSLIGDRDTQIY